MKMLYKIFCLTLIVMLVSCQPEEVTVNTGPLFPGGFWVEGTSTATGEAIAKELNQNETGIPVNAVFTIPFSKPLNTETVSVSLTQEGTPVDFALNIEGETIVVDPSSDFGFGTKYTLAIDKGIRGADGGMLVEGDLTRTFTTENEVTTVYDGQIFYMSFDNDFTESVSGMVATVVGTPGFAGEGVVAGNAYAGAADSYLTFPATGLHRDEVSASFWLKINAVPDRAGILSISPPDQENPDNPNNHMHGLRFFREGDAVKQRFKLNIGNGLGESWVDPAEAGDLDPTTNEWVHFAFSISTTQATLYINGQSVKQIDDFPGITWTDCDILSIMSGAPRFTGWGHLSDASYLDELRFFGKALTAEEVQDIFEAESEYTAKYEGETFYMPFEGEYTELITGIEPTVVGTPGFAGEGVASGNAYAGAADSYLTFPTSGLQGQEFSASFWLKINAVPDRAGILSASPPDPVNTEAPNNHTHGFRFFREADSGNQRFKLNVGNGTGEDWVDPGTAGDIPPTTVDWVHFAFSISQTESILYINGQVAKQATVQGFSWTDCDNLSIMSGAPLFTGWGHLSDQSYMDELRLFNRVITPEEVQAIMNGD